MTTPKKVNSEMCVCGHPRSLHLSGGVGVCDQYVSQDKYCRCEKFRPAPSQHSLKSKDKIAEIIKEFMEKFDEPFCNLHEIRPCEKCGNAEKWLTQTLTTLLNEE